MRGLFADGLTFQYGENDSPVLQECSLDIQKGRIVLLTGPSGCGKSTLCSLLAGIFPRHGGVLTSGSVCCDGVDIHRAPLGKRAQLISMMFQNPDLQFCMDTVENELIFCLENICVDPLEIPAKVEQALSFCGIFQLAKRQLHTLSGGEKQMVMLACMAALNSHYLVLDEPFANLDVHSSRLLCQKLKQFQAARETTILIVDHVITNFLSIADEVIVLSKNGLIVRRELHKDKLLQLPQLAQMGLVSEHKTVSKSAPSKNVILSLENVKAKYDGTTVLNSVNANFHEGCMTAITGQSGSGKSTLLSVLSRMRNYQGRVLLAGREISRFSRRGYAQQVGIAFQNPQDQFVAQTVYDEIAVSLRGHCASEEMPKRIQQHLEELGLWPYRQFSPYMLSQGQQRRLAVGAILAYKCRVLLCDEPTYGQDRRAIEAIMRILLQRVYREGLTVIFVTHDLDLAQTYGDYHYCCWQGKLYEHIKERGGAHALQVKSQL